MAWTDWPIIPTERALQENLRRDFINTQRELSNVVNRTERTCLENIEHLILNPPDSSMYYEWWDKLNRAFRQLRGYNTQHNNTWHPDLWIRLLAVVNQLIEQLGRFLELPVPPPIEGDWQPPPPPPAEPPPTPGIIEYIFSVVGFDVSMTFTITEPWKVTFLYTFHVCDNLGAKPGTIRLKAADGTTYGPWGALGKTQVAEQVRSTFGLMLDLGLERYDLWEAIPNVIIAPGTYTVLDSYPVPCMPYAAGFGIRSKFLTVS